MARVDIKLPDSLPFTTEVQLYLLHMNYGGHLDNALLLTVVTEARMRYFRALGFKESDVEGLGIVIADAAVQYRSEAFQGEVMQVAMAAAEFNRYGCDLVWRMAERDTGREVARGKTGIVFFDYRQRKVAPLPAEFRARAEAHAAGAAPAPA
jgi:4-hydroxybenzoyl-CoA thioesterase